MKELELILATIAQLGEAGKEAFIWWLIFDKLLSAMAWLIAIGLIANMIAKIVTVCNADNYSMKLRDAMGIAVGTGHVSSSEFVRCLQWIENHKK